MSALFTTPVLASLITDLEQIVAINTENPSRHELEAARWVEGRMREMGCATTLVEVLPERPNAIGVFENGPGPVFAFNTHMDVVPAGEGWSSDPFRLRREGGMLYGRGSNDAKGPLICMLEAIAQMIRGRDSWSGTLMGVFVADEEVGSAGARHYVKTAPKIDYCVVGEPTSCTTVAAHKGSMRPIVQVKGKTAHSGTPDLGINAIIEAAPLYVEVAREHARIKSRRHPMVGNPSLTITRANGGHADNVVPDLIEVMLDRRMIPGEDEDVVKGEIVELVARAAAASGAEMEIVDYRPTTGGPTETALDHLTVAAAQRACLKYHGHETPITGFQGGCDLVHFRQAGTHGVVLGPGDLAVAHKPDEFVPQAELVLAVQIYRDIAFDLLKTG
ncbi:MAG: M20 family metallopeptidase [Roseovarius sp.]|nr:M20 family metallopeptidase [Roseovarius sp.]MCY4291311.1 M20 family metallopeptidase [Roseovarius sp.]